MVQITDSIELPCGATLPNRLAKSAMSENMTQPKFFPGEEFIHAYNAWLKGQTGLLISGNVMVDSRFLGEPNNVVIEKGLDNFLHLKNWAKTAENFENHIWIQLNHPGKQTPKFLTPEPVAPSSIALKTPLDKMFNTPRELTSSEILEIINRFSYAAKIVKESGFHGVQIHGAHGYLVSQFLSPLHNQRTDEWGGSLEKRMRFVVEIYKGIRKEVGEKFPIGIKLNSADFQKGGFTQEESILVAKTLSDLGIDFIELSGGSYESPVMTGVLQKESTLKREAYFLEFAKDIKNAIHCPLMVTGGFRTKKFIEESLEKNEVDIVGLGRALCIDPNFSKKILENQDITSEVKPLSTGFKILDKIFPLEIIWYTMQIHLLGKKKNPQPRASVYKAIWNSIKEIGFEGLKRVRS
jgi:2,4-dienoyl-CoA reductase-like NADH-dependent reductase (Old Yellow Enzyme family)